METRLPPTCYTDGILYPGKCDNEPNYISQCSIRRKNAGVGELPKHHADYGPRQSKNPGEPCTGCPVYVEHFQHT